MLEEVEMPPGLLHRVVRRAVGLGAVGAREAATCREVDLDVEAELLSVEGGGLDQPRRHDAERQLQQIGITHGLSPAAPMSLHRAAVLAAVKVWPAGVEAVSRSARRPTLTAARYGGYRERQGGARGKCWGGVVGGLRINPVPASF